MTATLSQPRGAAASQPAACVIGTRPHLASDGLLLCQDHLDELGRWLREIEEEAARLLFDPSRNDWAALPRLETRYDSGGSLLASHLAPADLDAIAYTDRRSTAHGRQHVGPVCAWWRCGHESCEIIRADADEHDAKATRPVSVLEVLTGWADEVRAHWLITRPTRRVIDRVPSGHQGPICAHECRHVSCRDMRWVRDVPIPTTLTEERALLTKFLDWIAAQEWVADMRRELGELRAQLLRVNRNEPERPLPGHCPWLVDGVECGGDLWPTEPAYSTGYGTADGIREGPRAVVCGQDDKHRWEGRNDLARLQLIVNQQKDEERKAP